jgi:Fe-S cluster assembly ATP-binding protein
LKTAVNEIRKYRGEEPLDAVQFLKMFKQKMSYVNIDQSLLNRALNEGFSGGEKNVMRFSKWQY